MRNSSKPKNDSLLPRSTRWIAAGLMAAGVLSAPLASATILGPYSADSNTLHLWHMDEAAAPALDSVATGGTNLTASGGATLGNSSYPGFGGALSTLDGGQNQIGGTTSDAVLTGRGVGNPVVFTYANASGAFTFEALVRIDFDPAKNFGPTANGGNGRAQQCQIITCEANGTGSRVFQFRIDPIGTASPLNLTQPMLELIRVTGSQNILVPIPTNGPNAIASNNWYHVAVTYNGVPNTASNLLLYWTLLDPSRTKANLIGSANMTGHLSPVSSATTIFTIGNSGRNPSGNAANPLLANFLGLIDEVRLSKVARAANQMIFVDPLTIAAQPQSLMVAPGQTVAFSVGATTDFAPLSYQWRCNGVDLVDGGDISGATTATLQIANAQLAHSADYDCVIRNSRTPAPDSLTSAVARLTVRTLLDLAWRGTIDSTWNSSTANWLDTSSGTDVPFTTGDRVVFNDAGSSASLIRLTETVLPTTLTVDAAASYTLTGSGKISGVSGLTKLNSGTLTVSTTNDYTGPTYLGGGTLSVSALASGSQPSPIGAASSAGANLVFNGGALEYTGPSTAIDRSATLSSGGATISVTAPGSTLTMGGVLAGSTGGGLTKAGNGTLLLTSANPYNGPTAIAAGTLQLGGSGTLGSGSVLNDGTLSFSLPGAVNFANRISGAGSLFQNGAGNLTLSGVNSYSGVTIVSAGTLTLANSSALGNSPLVYVASSTGGAFGGTRVALNAGVTVDETVGLSLPSNSSGDIRSILFANGPSSWNGPISLNGNGTIAFSGTTVGPTIGGNISSPTFMGLLQLRVGAAYSGLIAGTVTLAPNSTVQINDGGTWTISSSGNSWGLSQIANGTLRMGQDYALPFDTTVELGRAGNGTLDLAGYNQQIAGLVVAGTANNQVIGNSSTLYDSTLTFSGPNSVYGGRIIDSLNGGTRKVSLEVAGGLLAFTAPQNYSGSTLVSGGTLGLHGLGAIDRSAYLAVTAGGTLDASGRADGKLTLAAGQTLQGDGTVMGNLVVGPGSTVSPGMGIGVLTNSGAVALAAGGSARIEISDATRGPGAGYDSLQVSGGINVQASSSNQFRIELASVGEHGVTNFDNNATYAWTIASATEGLTGYAPQAFVLDTASFSNDLAGGVFTLSADGLVVNFAKNQAPVANVATYVRSRDAALQISIADLAANWSDPDGDAVTLVSVTSNSTNGVDNVSTDGTNIFYTPGFGGNVADAISYTIRDVRSSYRPGDTVRTTVGTILVTVTPDETEPSLNTPSVPGMLAGSVTSLTPGTMAAVTSSGTASATYLQCLLNFEQYAESIWRTATYSGAPADAGYWGDGGNSGNGGIRGNGGVAVAYAVLVVALPDDPKVTSRLDRIRQALNYSAATHISGTNRCVNGSAWGWSNSGSTDWQTPEWTASLGLACVLVQNQLPAATVQAVQRVIASEANHRAPIAPASGYISDTKAEENAWDSNVLALGAAWMSTHPNAAQWLLAAKQYLVNSYTVADPAGDPLAGWVTTTTLYPSYALQNHGFYHPTYQMVSGMSQGDSLLMARLANPDVAAELRPFAEHNVMQVWNNNLSGMLMDSSDFAYPSGQDWEMHDFEQNSYLTWMAAHFNVPEARWADERMSQLVLYRQLVNGDGTFVGPSGGGFYREAVEARRTAIAWLHWANTEYPTGPSSAPSTPNLVHYADVGVIGHRGASGFFSLSYGSRIMASLEPAAVSIPTNAFLTTPRLPGMIGMGAMGTPTSAQLVSYTTNANGFDAELTLQYGNNGTAEVFIKSAGESVGIVEVPRPAPGVKATAAGSFAVGIENDPLCGGTRLLEWAGGTALVTNRSGFGRNISNNWVCVAGRYGMAAGPSGYFNYQAATSYNRSGGAEDTLQFMPANSLAPRYAVWFPGKTAEQTATNASAISWATVGTTAVLTFPGPDGVAQQMAIPLTANGTWSADASGAWSDTNNWSGGLVASGPGYTADLSALNLTADRIITLDSSRAIGTLKFGESFGSQNWVLDASGASVLTLDAGASIPASIVVNQNTAAILAPLAGANGFIKSGAGTLILGGANALGGTLYVDSGSTATNDGALRVTSSAALAGLDAISIRNSSAGASTFQLDGTDGGIVVAQPLTVACRASAIPSIQSVAGNNVLAGNLYMQTGGSNVVVQSDSGTLTLLGTLRYVGNLTAARAFNFSGAGDTLVSGSILAPANGAVLGLGKFGSGTLTLEAASTYTGPTTVNAGTLLVNGSLANSPVTVAGGVLGGAGVINGPVTIQPAGQLQPGNGGTTGTLAINNTLKLAGTTLLVLNKANAQNSSRIVGVSSLTLGGTLRVINNGPALQVGDEFQLFAADSYLNGFDSLELPPLAPGLVWNTAALLQNGTLSIGQLPTITLPPANQVVECSSNATFTVAAVGSLPLAYQWSLDGVAVPGATGASFTMDNLHGAGSVHALTVEVTNRFGSVSVSATLSVQDTLAPVLALKGANPVIVECHDAYAEEGASAVDACAGPVPVTIQGVVNTAVVGTYTLTYSAQDGNGQRSELSRTVIVRDTTPPVVTLNGASSLTVECHSSFTDPGATATDSSAGSLNVKVAGSVNPNVVGKYVLTYSATDPSGNTATATRTVTVVDTVAPVVAWSFGVLTLNAGSNCTVPMPNLTGTNYILATDSGSSEGLIITQSPTNGTSLTLGTNVVVLSVADSSANLTKSTNLVVVADKTAPVITVLGPNWMNTRVRSPFVDPGATALDNCSGVVSLTTNNPVNFKKEGTYTVQYVASDSAGNTATNTRVVHVVDVAGPLIIWSFGQLTLSAGTNDTVRMPDVTGTNYLLVDYDDGTPLSTRQCPAAGSPLAPGTNRVILQVSVLSGKRIETVCSTNWIIVTGATAPQIVTTGETAPEAATLQNTVQVSSARLKAPAVKNGKGQLKFSGPNGRAYKLLASPDLSQPLSRWTELTNGVFGATEETFIDPSVTNTTKRFYRIVAP